MMGERRGIPDRDDAASLAERADDMVDVFPAHICGGLEPQCRGPRERRADSNAVTMQEAARSDDAEQAMGVEAADQRRGVARLVGHLDADHQPLTPDIREHARILALERAEPIE